MAAETPGRDPQRQDPKTLWQDQETETDPMTLDHIHDLARGLDRKTRLTPVVMALGLVLCGFLTARLWAGAHDDLGRAAAILFLLGQLGCGLVIWRVVFPSRDPAEPAGAHLRRRLQRRLSYLRGGLVVALAPLLPFLLIGGYEAFRAGQGPLLAKIAPFVLLAATLVFVLARARVGAEQTRAQLDELNDLLKR
jgi:hypothetical protein